MDSVIVTRPTGQAIFVSNLLRSYNYRPIQSPVLTIAPCDGTAPAITDVAAVLATSANAFVGAAIPSSLQALPCYCVGGPTAHAARAAGFERVIEGQADGEALALKITHDVVSGSSVLHLCGRDVDARASEILSKAGLPVVTWVRYEAQLVPNLTEEALTAIRSGDVAAVLVYSTRSAQNFMRLVEKAGIFPAMKRVGVVAISQTVANLFNPVEWRWIAVADQPSDEAMVQSLNKICAPTKGSQHE